MRHSFVHPIPLPPAGTDGLNRLPRPLKIFGVIGLFVWAVADPPAFLLAMLALQNVPEMLWYIFLAVIGFCFGTKMIEKAPRRAGSQSGSSSRAISVGACSLRPGSRSSSAPSITC